MNTSTVSELRSYMRSLSKRRTSRVVTADDANAFLQKKGVPTKRVRARLSHINSVLRAPDFTNVGRRQSARDAARGRNITEWQYSGK